MGSGEENEMGEEANGVEEKAGIGRRTECHRDCGAEIDQVGEVALPRED